MAVLTIPIPSATQGKSLSVPRKMKGAELLEENWRETFPINYNFLIDYVRQLNHEVTFTNNFKAQWLVTTVTTPDDWIYVGKDPDVPFKNSWRNSTTSRLRFRKIADAQVSMEGIITGGALNTTIFTLPELYRPDVLKSFAISASSAFGDLVVFANGDVQLVAGATTFSCNGQWTAADRTPVPTNLFPINFATSLVNPKLCILTDIQEINERGTLFTTLTPSGRADWDYITLPNGQKAISVLDVPGLIPFKKYQMTFLVVES
jgi:hypothetical protein